MTISYIAIGSVSIGLLFRKYDMIDIAWWERIPHNEPKLKITDECNRVRIIKVFSQFLVIGFFHSFFCDRKFISNLPSRVSFYWCNNGTADFKSIYDLKLKLQQQRKDYKDLLDLLRHICNTIHNNGVYFHPDGKNKTVTYKGEQYMFDIGKPVKFRGRVLNFLVGLMPDILKMIEDVLYSQDILSRN